MRRPSVFAVGALWAGLVLAGCIQLPLWTAIAAMAATVVIMLAIKRAAPAFLLFMMAFFILGFLRSPDACWNRPGIPAPAVGGRFPCIIRVSGPSPLGKWRRPLRVRVESVIVGYPWLESRDVFLLDAGESRIRLDGGCTFLGTFYPPRPRLNPYGWDTALRYRREGVAGTVVGNPADYDSGQDRLFSHFRERIRGLVRSVGTDATRGVLEALLLGERTDLTPEVKDAMLKAGIYHVVAVSGLHVGIIVLLVSCITTVAGPPRAVRISLALVCVTAYVFLTGARPSALRAGCLFLFLSLIRYLQWKVDIPNCVCTAGLALLLAFPYLAWDVGFRLSLGAVFGITLLVPQLHAAGRGGSGLGKLAAYIRLGMLASFSAQVGALPVLLYHFGRVSLMGVLSNLVVLPLVTLAVASGLEAAVAGFVWERLGLVFMKGASALVAVAIWLASHSTRYVDPVVFAGRPHAIRLLAYVCGLGFIGFLCPRLRRRWKLLALIGLYGFLVTPGLQGRSSGIALTFIHVGDGDACLAELGRGETLLIDAGTGPGDYDAGRLCVLPLLAMKGLKHLDTVILTHSHNDHYGGLASLIGNVDIGRVVIGSQEGEGGYLDVLDRCREKGIPVQGVGRGDTLVCGDAGLEILHPSAAYLGHGTGDPNAQSVVVRLVYGKTMFLFTGDLTPEVQQELVHAGFDLSCDVLKVPHHGAPGGLDRGFLYGCGARYAVISAGSRFASHPCPDVIGLLEGSGARTFVTKRHGAVTISGDGEDLRIRTEVQGRVIPGSLSSSASRLDAAAPRW